MTRPQFDLTIIGAGSGGLTAARVAAGLGARVLLIDKERIGGDCLYYGCIPSKSLLHAARLVRQAQQAMQLSLASTTIQVDMEKVAASIQDTIQRVSAEEEQYARDVTLKIGQISFLSPNTLLLNGEKITSRSTLVATGSHAAVPEIEGLAASGYLTNATIFDLTSLPRSLLVVGGGPIGVELGQALQQLGTQVTLVQKAEHILPREDAELSSLLTDSLRAEGMQVLTNSELIKVARQGTKKIATIHKGAETLTLESDELLLAVGRRPNLRGLNLEAAGVECDASGIKVNARLQTSTKNILAIGDVIGGYHFTHVAAYQASIAVRNALLPFGKKKVDYRFVPWCTFTDPEVARVGLTIAQAGHHYSTVRVVTLPWSSIDRAQTEQATVGLLKLVLAGKKDTIVGAHMIGRGAGEMLGELTLAMRNNLSINDIFNTIHTYPTMNTGIQQAAFEAYLTSNVAANNRRVVSSILNLRH